MILGVDPGHTGGAVLLDGRGTPVAWWAWHELDRKGGNVYALDRSDPNYDRFEFRTLAGVGEELRLDLREHNNAGTLHLAVEGLYVDRRFPETAIKIADARALVVAPLREAAASYEEPRASVWRPAVLGCRPNASSDAAERLARALWGRRWTGATCDDPHVAEAFCIGWWRHTRREAA